MPQNSLHNLPIGIFAIVKKLEHKDAGIRRRLLDIGLTQGARVICLYQSPAKDPRAYLIRDAVIALRKEEAEGIKVKYKNAKPPKPVFPHKKTAHFFSLPPDENKKLKLNTVWRDLYGLNSFFNRT